jgi:hypothetical protein
MRFEVIGQALFIKNRIQGETAFKISIVANTAPNANPKICVA